MHETDSWKKEKQEIWFPCWNHWTDHIHYQDQFLEKWHPLFKGTRRHRGSRGCDAHWLHPSLITVKVAGHWAGCAIPEILPRTEVTLHDSQIPCLWCTGLASDIIMASFTKPLALLILHAKQWFHKLFSLLLTFWQGNY